MGVAKGRKFLTRDNVEFAVHDSVHDFRTHQVGTVVKVHKQRAGSRPLYEIKFPEVKETAMRLRDDLDAA